MTFQEKVGPEYYRLLEESQQTHFMGFSLDYSDVSGLLVVISLLRREIKQLNEAQSRHSKLLEQGLIVVAEQQKEIDMLRGMKVEKGSNNVS